MHFAHPVSIWVSIALAALVTALTVAEYRRPLAPLTIPRRAALAALRALTLSALIVFLLRPVSVTSGAAHDAVVPVLVDVSQSMRLADADGRPRLARALAIARSTLAPALSRNFRTELLAVGESVSPLPGSVSASATRSDLTRAIVEARERYRGEQVAAIVLVSDGGETSPSPGDDARVAADGPPVFAVGVGSTAGPRDREVTSLTAGEQRLDRTTVDLRVSAVSRGFGRAPFNLRLSAGGRVIERRRVTPYADGAPIVEVFTVSPDAATPTVYTADIAADAAEDVPENNAREALVTPAGRKRRLLIVEGAPGFEQSFIKRAWALDPGLDVDAVVRKGKNADGHDTFMVQAAAPRAPSLAAGFPARKEDTYAYDALVLSNVEADFFTRTQLATIGEFVSERGGGLLVMGGRSLSAHGLIGSPLEETLPVELNDRRSGVVRTSMPAAANGPLKVSITADGETHPVMRLREASEETRSAWASLPALAAVAPLGGPRAGAVMLATTTSPTGAVYPLVAVQRFGRGRSMIFAGEASWRWKMLMPAADRTFETFWRQAARWLASTSPDRLAISAPRQAEPGDTIPIDLDVRDAVFGAVGDATIAARLSSPDGGEEALTFRRTEPGAGRYTATVRAAKAGAYRVSVDARTPGGAFIGSAEEWIHVGAAVRELADPRLNEAYLRRLARASGGRYVPAAEAAQVASWLQTTARPEAPPESRDAWHEPWAFALVIAALCVEWALQRRWGLR